MDNETSTSNAEWTTFKETRLLDYSGSRPIREALSQKEVGLADCRYRHKEKSPHAMVELDGEARAAAGRERYHAHVR